MSLRLFMPQPLAGLPPGALLDLPAGPARHVQVRRLQPGDTLALFDGSGRDRAATVRAMGKTQVQVELGEETLVQRELPLAVTLALVMPSNDRMDDLVEKATELGVAALQPLTGERSVLRLHGERAHRKQAHWQAIAQAACEQCGRAVVPTVAPVQALDTWLRKLPKPDATVQARLLLSLAPGARHPAASLAALAACAAPLPGPLPGPGSVEPAGLPTSPQPTPPSSPPSSTQARPSSGPGPGSAAGPDRTAARPALLCLSGPEGGLAPAEEAEALAAGFLPTGLGPRTLRADTAPLALLAWAALHLGTAAPAPPGRPAGS